MVPCIYIDVLTPRNLLPITYKTQGIPLDMVMYRNVWSPNTYLCPKEMVSMRLSLTIICQPYYRNGNAWHSDAELKYIYIKCIFTSSKGNCIYQECMSTIIIY